MKSLAGIGLADVQAVYGGPEGNLWKLVMGEQIHIGGFDSSMDLAQRANLGSGVSGVDLCCCRGAGMRFLVRFRKVDRMTGVDATPHALELARKAAEEEKLADRLTFVLADVTASGLPDGSSDFAWGEDAWCYVVDKKKLISEAARIVKRGGAIAFTDWVEGPVPMSDAEAERFLRFMKFPNMQDVPGYAALLRANGCDVLLAEDTGRFAPCIDLYLNMLGMQLKYDALRIIGFDAAMMEGLGGEMVFTQQLAKAGKLIQARFIARKR